MGKLTPGQVKIIEKVTKRIDGFWNVYKKSLRQEIRQEIEDQMTIYKSEISRLNDWCCRDFEKLAVDMFHRNSPQDEGLFGITYILNHIGIKYCPYCGVKL